MGQGSKLVYIHIHKSPQHKPSCFIVLNALKKIFNGIMVGIWILNDFYYFILLLVYLFSCLLWCVFFFSTYLLLYVFNSRASVNLMYIYIRYNLYLSTLIRSRSLYKRFNFVLKLRYMLKTEMILVFLLNWKCVCAMSSIFLNRLTFRRCMCETYIAVYDTLYWCCTYIHIYREFCMRNRHLAYIYSISCLLSRNKQIPKTKVLKQPKTRN